MIHKIASFNLIMSFFNLFSPSN